MLRSGGLVADDLRRAMAATAAANCVNNAALAAARDPAAATAARLQKQRGASGQEAKERDGRMARLGSRRSPRQSRGMPLVRGLVLLADRCQPPPVLRVSAHPQPVLRTTHSATWLRHVEITAFEARL